MLSEHRTRKSRRRDESILELGMGRGCPSTPSPLREGSCEAALSPLALFRFLFPFLGVSKYVFWCILRGPCEYLRLYCSTSRWSPPIRSYPLSPNRLFSTSTNQELADAAQYAPGIRYSVKSVDAYLLEELHSFRFHADSIWNDGDLGSVEEFIPTGRSRTTKWAAVV